jgi:hypothetical protein
MITVEQAQQWVPEGWTVEEYAGGKNLIALGRPQDVGGGFVTIDCENRFFCSGLAVPHRPWAPLQDMESFKGAGWRERIVRAAVTWLDQAMTSRD